MKIQLFVSGLLLLSGAATHVQAAVVKDITPVSVKFQRVVVNDITGAQSLRISVMVKNVGPTVIKASSGGVLVAAIWNTAAALYGPNGNGGFNLGAPIRPGQTGMFLLYGPLNSLRHCQKYKIMVDTTRSIQAGPTSIYYNDSRLLQVVDTGATFFCGGVLQP